MLDMAAFDEPIAAAQHNEILPIFLASHPQLSNHCVMLFGMIRYHGI